MSAVTGKIQGLNQRLVAALCATAEELGSPITVVSGYRSIEEQRRLYEGYKKGLPGFNLAAPPGRSNHNFHTAADIRPRLAGNAAAARHGLLFPVRGEPWHAEIADARSDAVRAEPVYQGGPLPSGGGTVKQHAGSIREVAVAVIVDGDVDREIAGPMARAANLALLEVDHAETVRHAYIVGRAAHAADRNSYEASALMTGPTRLETAALVERWLAAYTAAGSPQLRSLQFTDVLTVTG